MDLSFRATVDAPADRLREALDDLATYPHWLGLVDDAVPSTPNAADEGRAWDVSLLGRVGLVTRRKRVRMVATAPGRFERQEHDGRLHSAWILRAAASDAGVVEVSLHYGGAPQLPGLEMLLRFEAARAGARLEAFVRRQDDDG